MIIYLIKSGVCLALVLTIYILFLEREKMHQFNRFYLLFGLIFSFTAPLITLEYSGDILGEYKFWEGAKNTEMEISDKLKTNNTSVSSIQSETILLIVYVIGFSLFLIQFSIKIFSLLKKVFSYKKVNFRNARLVLIEEDYLPHTFLNFIFINRTAFEKNSIEEELFIHELAHAKQGHSFDVLLIEIVKTIFWFNPVLIFYKKAIQLNHEFLADEAVLSNLNQVKDYQHLLLNKAASNKRIYLASNLNFLVTKKRLKMMTKNTSRLKANTLAMMTVPLFVCMLLLFGNKVVAQKTISEKENKERIKARDAYFKNATFVCEEDKDRKVYKAYQALTDEEKAAIPPPPPPPPTADGIPMKIAPLPKGTLVHYNLKGKDKKVWIDQSGELVPPPPPPPPALAPPPPPPPPAATAPPPPPPPPKGAKENQNK